MISRLNYKHIVALAVISVSAAATATNLPSAAARFIVSPLRVEIAAARNFAAFQVDNNGDQVLAVQARIFAWTQVNGEDRYTPTSDVVATPSIVRIEAQATQHFKIVQRTKIDAGVEQRYRVVVDQLPTPTNPGNGVAATRLRVASPIFVGRDGASPANLQFLPENGGAPNCQHQKQLQNQVCGKSDRKRKGCF